MIKVQLSIALIPTNASHMKLWYISLLLSIVSCIILMAMCFVSDEYSVFNWSKNEVQAGVLFPVLLISWATSLLAFLFNNIFIDKRMMQINARRMPSLKAYLPTLLGIPSFTSFIWFIIRWYKGKPDG